MALGTGGEDERDWVIAASRGDEKALALLYDRYASLLMAVGVRVLGDRREAEDLLHDVFLEDWRKAGTYDPKRGTVRAWLVMRMRSRALDRARSASRSKVVLSDTADSPDRPDPRGDPSVSADHRVLHDALEALPEEQQRVLELGYFGGMSSSEMSAALGVPIGTVKSRVSRGLTALRRALAPPEGGLAS